MPLDNQGFRPVNMDHFDLDIIERHRLKNNLMVEEKFFDGNKVFENDEDIKRVFLINPGPSSRVDDFSKLRKLCDRTNQLNVLCGSAISFLASGTLEKEDVDAVVFNNPLSAYEDCFDNDTDLTGVKVFVASHCKPAVFEKLKNAGADIVPFNAYVEGVSPPEFYEGEDTSYSIAIGQGAATSAISLFTAMGFKNFEAIGWDGTKEYAAGLEHLNIPDDEENPFDNDVAEFGLLALMGKIKSIFLHGDGPTAKLINADGNKPRTDFSVFKKVVETIPSAPQPSV